MDAGTISFTLATYAAYLITINQSLTAGWYWLAFNLQSGTTTWLGTSASQGQSIGTQRMSTNTGASANTLSIAYSQASVTGAFPTPATPVILASGTSAPIAYLRAT